MIIQKIAGLALYRNRMHGKNLTYKKNIVIYRFILTAAEAAGIIVRLKPPASLPNFRNMPTGIMPLVSIAGADISTDNKGHEGLSTW